MVNNLRAKNKAGEAARNTVGVREVRNFIQVRPTEGKSDKALAADIANALRWNPYLERFALSVHARNNKAYLYGTVDSYFEKLQAEKVATGVAGVVSVENRISVRPRTPQDLSDIEIKRRIESKLAYSSLVSAENITVRVEDGIATLNGTVSSVDALNAAVHGAFGGGARGVRSELEVEGFPGDSPRMPESYEWDSYVWP
jgi:osmotically-inducible protein OsmY